MHYSIRKPYYFALFFCAFFLLCIAVIELLHRSQVTIQREQVQLGAKEQLSNLRFNLEAELVADIYQVSTLASLVSLRSDLDEDDWALAASRILARSHYIKIIGIAENDIVGHIFPRQGNQQMIGVDYQTVPQQWEQVQKARTIEEAFIAGPVSLVQGGKGLIVRVPAFRDPPINKQYWGVISAVIDLEQFLLDVGVIDFARQYKLVIRGENSSGEQGRVFFGQEGAPDSVYARERVRFPYGGWGLAVSSDGEVEKQIPWHVMNMVRLAGYPILVLLCLSLLTIYRLYVIAESRALHDELTALPNRRFFMHSFKAQFELAQRYRQQHRFALINVDLDRFKYINDTFGHEAGDRVLKACAERITTQLRRSDMVARMGGDEFLLIVHQLTKEDDLQRLLKKLRYALCSTPVGYDGQAIYLSVSMGASIFEPGLHSPEQMLKIADERMYQQKHLGE
ncbi:diguanylate cyclase [Vibrio sp. CAU 1672]|uniref:diguanylate cyclase n=1 Tax=Vibrio sp. CAU 1672 TaxID=3032594 RepID=UPI0023D9E5C6|nr:diguanylate cyclase [Vibrio sp. CAU 1672]MDF2152555.1 diguanylate cyclase [Vibrio sp. CAU 1672]